MNDFERPETSKIDPYGFGLVFVDIQVIREMLLYELLKNYIDNDEYFMQLLTILPQNELTKEALRCYNEVIKDENANKIKALNK